MLPEEIREPAVTEEEEPVPTEMDTENEDHNTDPAVHANQEEELPAADEDDSEGDVSEGILENDDPADDSIEADAEPEQVENSDTETVAALETSTSNPTMEVSETTDLEMETLEKEPEIAELPAEQTKTPVASISIEGTDITEEAIPQMLPESETEENGETPKN